MGLSLGQPLSYASAALALTRGGGVPPSGFVFLTDADGAILTDADGAYLIEAA